MPAIAHTEHTKLRIMRFVLLISIALMGIKIFAWLITTSNAILTDAVESLINVSANGFAFFSVWYAAKPKDIDHPYGHGKIEYIAVGFEGGLILIAAIAIIARAVYSFFYPPEISSLDTGLLLTAFAGLVNFAMGGYLIAHGKRLPSLTMEADGKHLLSDALSSAVLVIGLLIIYFTDIYWIDSALALAFGSVILWTGIQLIRQSVSTLLDEADFRKLEQIMLILNKNRRIQWIDIHNLRALKHGSKLHVDCHLTLPWYAALEATHQEMKRVETLVQNEFSTEVEFFIHPDPCVPDSCPICQITDCPERKKPFVKKVEWTLANLLLNHKHRIAS